MAVLPISDRLHDYAAEIAASLSENGVRSWLDGRSETLGFKIRDAEKQKIPLTLVVGDQEVENGTVTPRLRHAKAEDERSAMPRDVLVAELAQSVAERRRTPFA